MTETPRPSAPPVLTEVAGRAGIITLNRPRAINALTLEMIGLVNQALDAFADDPAVHLVVLDGEGERGLCAGGDVRHLYDMIVAGDAERCADFFLAEYALNARIAEFPKPVVALADGVTMGGGIGLAGHAAIRVVTERSTLAMPETRIGFTPDVGGTWLLGRAPGHAGEYLAVTATTMDAADAIYAGLADVVVPAARLGELRAALRAPDPRSPLQIVDEFSVAPGPSALQTAQRWVDDAFSADTMVEVVERLAAHDEPAARRASEAVATLAPTSMTVALQAVRRARALPDLRAVLAQEYGLVMWFVMTRPDLVEGIRAQLVDKDHDPRWNPATLTAVDADVAASAFAFTPAVPLWD